MFLYVVFEAILMRWMKSYTLLKWEWYSLQLQNFWILTIGFLSFQTGQAWFCTVLSAFGVVILSVIAHLFNSNHESFVGSINDPEDGPAYVTLNHNNISPFFKKMITNKNWSYRDLFQQRCPHSLFGCISVLIILCILWLPNLLS